MVRRAFLTVIAACAAVLAPGPLVAADPFIIVQSTTSTENSGLFDELLPKFQDATGIEVRVVAVGTGQALKNAQNCDGDVLFVHAKPDEEKFVAAGYGVERFDVMYNDFVIVGPTADPAKIGGTSDAAAALKSIAEAKAAFASRADDSGTYKKEMSLWQAAGVDPSGASGEWYRETGSGMGATLNAAVGMGAYVLTDRGTWLSFENKDGLQVKVEGDPRLFNQYGVIRVDPDHCPNVREEAGEDFVDWVLGPDGQAAIAGYQIDGQQLFFPNAKPSG